MESQIMKLLQDLRDVMKRMDVNLNHILELENQKYTALKQVDMENLNRINTDEEDYILYSDSLDKKRMAIIMDLAETIGFDKSLRLEKMLEYFPIEWHETFREIRDSIRKKTHKLEITMKENAEIIKSNLEIVNFTLSLVHQDTDNDTYDYHNKKKSEKQYNLIDRMA